MKQKTFTSVRNDEHVVSESAGRRSREQIVLSSPAANVLAGTVLGKITATGEYTPLNVGGADGSETAVAILGPNVEATDPATDRRSVALVRDCEVNGNLLAWPAGITGPQKIAAEAELADNGVIVRY